MQGYNVCICLAIVVFCGFDMKRNIRKGNRADAMGYGVIGTLAVLGAIFVAN